MNPIARWFMENPVNLDEFWGYPFHSISTKDVMQSNPFNKQNFNLTAATW